MADDEDNLRELVASVAAAYFSNSHVASSDISGVITQIASSLAAIGPVSAQSSAAEAPAPSQTRATPAQIRRSITPDALMSFEDGKPYKTMKRHLSGRGLTPEQYREKWGLPHDYPMVAPSYSEARAAMARELGLGQRGAQARAAASKAKAARGRKS
ncbi:MucR family transcriptional regulator [Phenylobacterium immobile]|uniref:MucR family transcriptional regulator n=1 Tax=Phenylobacterium immobile TaxID=21 RepID=UPI000AB7D7BB|nr:MucR family transcriptional regulator [Phenylobacterium immobile]